MVGMVQGVCEGGFVQRSVFGEVLLGWQLGEPEMEDRFRSNLLSYSSGE